MKRIPQIILLVASFLVSVNLTAQPGKDEIEVKVYTNGITITNKTNAFYAPHTVSDGDSFKSLSMQYYGTDEYAVYLSEVNKKSPLEKLADGSSIYIVSDKATLLFRETNSQAILDTIQEYLATYGSGTALTCVWDDADIGTELLPNGDWVINKYLTGKLRIFRLGLEGPELHLAFAKKPLLDIITLNDTTIDSASIAKE